MIVGTQGIAVGQQYVLVVQPDYAGIRKKPTTRSLDKITADQKIPVAMHEIDPNTGLCQCPDVRFNDRMAK